jgi:hypothetical protein
MQFSFVIYYVMSICKFYVSFKSCNQIKLVCFQNSLAEMVKSGMVLLTEREKADVTDADVVVGWMLWDGAGLCWSAGGQEGERKLM